MELESSFFFYNKSQRGKKYSDIKKINRYDRYYYTPLINAVVAEDIAEVKKVLDQGADPNIAAGNGTTALIEAIVHSRFDILTLLLKRGAVPDDQTLHEAKSYRRDEPQYLELVQSYYRPPKKEKPEPRPRVAEKDEKHIFVDYDEAYELKSINEWETKNGRYHESLTAAVMFDRPLSVLTQLLEEGSNINLDDPVLGTPLSQAVVQGRDKEYIVFLLNYKADPNQISKPNRRWPFLDVVVKNNLELTAIFIEFGAKLWFPEAEGLTNPFSYVLKYGSFAMAKLLLENGADPTKKLADPDDGRESWPFLLAAGTGSVNTDLLNLLVSLGADPKVTDDKGCNALALLPWSDENIPAAIRLLELGVSPKNPCVYEKHKQSPYHWAVRSESKELFQAIAKTKLSPNVFDDDESSPLYLAVIFDHPWFVKALIDAGANVNKCVVAPGVIFADYRGIHKAAEDLLAEAIIHTDSQEIIETILDAGVKINVVSNSPDRLTALHVAVEENKPELAELILKRKSVNKNAKNIDGETPLHMAVHAQDTKFVKLLVNAGAKLDVKDNRGLTPVDHARGEKKEKELLEAMGL
jgi:ankyrin repeat protein